MTKKKVVEEAEYRPVVQIPAKYRAARVEAERFLARLGALEMRYLNDVDARYLAISGSKEASAAKRASLDLTRALADIEEAVIALEPPRYPRRNGYTAGECGRQPLKDLERWVKGLTFHPYGVPAHDRAETVEEALENMRECPGRLEFTGEMLAYRGYVEFWITYQQAGDPDSYGFGGAYFSPEDAAYAALSMIEAHEREMYEENLVAGLA